MDFSLGPLFYLQWFGRLCPCLEKDEDTNARHAVRALQRHGIEWKQPQRSSPKSLLRIFTGGDSDAPTAVPALLIIIDNEDNDVALLIDPDAAIPPGAARNTPASNTQKNSSVGYKLNIAIRRVDKVTLDNNNDIVLFAKPHAPNAAPKELLRFVFVNADDHLPLPDSERNTLVHHLSVIVEWERQRRFGLGYEDEIDEADMPNFLTARAQKAAHFAKRELELSKTKQQRDQRKAELVQQSGGLKYTALAMASQGETA